jgi:hypothetical protein
MSKTSTVGIRIEPELKQALERAAIRESRSLSALIVLILEEWAQRLKG